MVKFYLSRRKDKLDDYPIRVSVSIRGARLISVAGYSIAPDKWNAEKQRVKKGCSNARKQSGSVINARLLKIESHFADYENKLDGKPTNEELAAELAKVKGSRQRKKENRNAVYYLDQFILEQTVLRQWADNTIGDWKALRYNFLAQGPNFKLSDLDEAGLNNLIHFFRVERGMNESTIRGKFILTRHFVRWCLRKGYTTERAALDYKPVFKPLSKPIIFLTKEELLKLYSYEIPANGTVVELTDSAGKKYEWTILNADTLEWVKDVFLFCCFTGLRFSDAQKLRKSDVKEDHICVLTKKTHKDIKIELNDYSRAILAKYKDNYFPEALPEVACSVENLYIKNIGELCGFDEPINVTQIVGGKIIEHTLPKWRMLTTHTGRKTFICFALSSGISPQVVMKWTGHADYQSMKPYIAIAENAKAEAMELFNRKMEE